MGAWLMDIDSLLVFMAVCELLKGGVIVTFFWWAWFRKDRSERDRERMIAVLIGSLFAMALARVMALSLPFRVRPLHNPELEITLPYTMIPDALEDWSAFPSDHAVLFFALSTGIWLISRKAGLLAVAYTTLAICFPRIYLGLHHPTDILAGAAIGIGITLLADRFLSRRPMVRSLLRISEEYPGLYYPLFFLFCYQVADLFIGSRDILSYAGRWFRHIVL
jgi:undecaprenyl-diphosphatase